MSPRALQALAMMQNAIQNMNTANNLLLQELAELLEAKEQERKDEHNGPSL